MANKIHQRIIDRPYDKYLNKHVREKVCAAGTNKWWDLGIELMGPDDVDMLNIIKANNTDIVECCSKMFTEWCQRAPKPSWRLLIDALNGVKLIQLASELEELLMTSEEYQKHVEQESKVSQQQQLEKQQLSPQELEDGEESSMSAADTITKDLAYFSFLLTIVKHWEANGIALKLAKEYLSSYCDKKVLTCCDENDYRGFYQQVINNNLTIPVLKGLAKVLKCDHTTQLIEEYMKKPVQPELHPSKLEELWIDFKSYFCNIKTAFGVFISIVGGLIGQFSAGYGLLTCFVMGAFSVMIIICTHRNSG